MVAYVCALLLKLRKERENKQTNHRCSITPLTVIFFFTNASEHKRMLGLVASLEKPGQMNHMQISLGRGGRVSVI